jgi:MFS family permease
LTPPPRWSLILWLQASNGLSSLGNSMIWLALPWLVLQYTGSVAAAGLTVAVSSAPGALAAPLAGWAVDRFGRRVVSIFADLLSAISVIGIPIAATVGQLSLGVIIGLAVLGAVFDPAGYTGRKALIVDVAREARYDTDKLNGIHEGVFALGFALGPLIAAGAIATIGPVNTFWLPAVAFVLAAALIAGLRVSDAGQQARADAAKAGEAPSSFWSTVTIGITVVWRDRLLRAMTLALLVLSAVYLPTETVILPAYFEDMNNPWALGAVLAAMSAGGILGGFTYGWIASRWRRIVIARVGLFGVTIAVFLMALLPPTLFLIAAGFALGLFWGPMMPLINTLVQRRVAPDAQGRVFGLQLSLFYAAPPLGMLLSGIAIESVGLPITYLVVAAALAVTSIGVSFAPPIYAIDD